MTTKAERPYDIVLWGATGFTGTLVAEYLSRHHPGLPWALAGRSRDKLERVRAGLIEIDPKAANLPILVADAGDPASLATLASAGRVIITTVGPYAIHGPALVAACVEQGTDYCDLTGEPQFVRRMIDQHHTHAQATGARIVHCCGFDSIPSDLGVLLLQDAHRERHGAPLDEVRFFLGRSSGGVSGGTVASALNIFAEARRDPGLRRQLDDPYLLDPGHGPGPESKDQRGVRFDKDARRWTAPFVMAAINTRIVRRSNALLGYRYGRDFRYSEVMGMRGGPIGLVKAAGITAGLGAFMGSLQVAPLRRLIARTMLPKPGEGPSKKARENGFFEIDLIGLAGGKVAVRGRIEGQADPGYGETAKMLSEAAICLAHDQGRPTNGKPGEATKGGVLTPASCQGVRLVERLRAAGMTFSVSAV